MNTSNRRRTRSLFLGFAVLLGLGSLAVTPLDSRFEAPPILRAQDLAPPTLLNGNGFHVDNRVPTDGMTANYTIHTDLGALQAHGLQMLRIRVAEVPAMVELQNTSKTKCSPIHSQPMRCAL